MRVMSRVAVALCILALLSTAPGCARNRPAKEPVAVNRSATVDAPFAETWESTRDAFLSLELPIYTRDKRGFFVAYSPQKRKLLTPRRMQYTIILEPIGPDQTRIELETIPQRYLISLLTYPSWQDDPKAPMPDRGEEIMAKIMVLLESTESSS